MRFSLATDAAPTILCLGAHSDDIEIGAGALLLRFAESWPGARIVWCVFSGSDARRAEARASAEYFTRGYENARIDCFSFRDGHFPSQLREVKEKIEAIKSECSPDLILTHYLHDRHQDHRVIAELTWQTFRDHLILEYEVPKYDGDFGSPNLYQPVSLEFRDRKLEALERFFETQRSKSWFSAETFSAVMRLRGVECNAESGYAEAFYSRKAVF